MDDTPIGGIQTRRLDDGRAELGSMDADGGIVTPELRHLSADMDMPSVVWLRSAEIEVTKEPVLGYLSCESLNPGNPDDTDNYFAIGPATTCPQVDIRSIDVQHIGTIYQ